MDDKNVNRQHKMILNNRQIGNFTGVLDVLSFDEDEIVLKTELGMLVIKGKNLHVKRLNLEKGEVDTEGQVDVLTYSKGNNARSFLWNWK